MDSATDHMGTGDDTEEFGTNSSPVSQPPKTDWGLTAKSVTTTLVVVGGMLLLFGTVQPNLLFRNNTPTGGDMGAHVWGPAYLRDVLLPHWKLTGWSMDWYAGFPAYRFYMVVPALFMLLLDFVLPYGIAFKLIAVSGIVLLPLCVWGMGKIAKLRYPFPELLVVAAVLFVYDESFTIYGGNIASTMAGEFSFSIALAFAVLAFGLFARGLDDGRHRGWAAFAIAMSALCHGIVLIFVFGGVALMLLLRLDRQRLRYGVSTIGTALLLSAFWVIPFLGGHAFMTDMKYEPRPSGPSDSFWKMFFPLATPWNVLLAVLAIAGFVGSLRARRFLGVWMGVYSVILMMAVVLTRDSLPVIGLLWNPRLLPFVYLLRYMLATIGVYEIVVTAVRVVQAERFARQLAEAEANVAATRPSSDDIDEASTEIVVGTPARVSPVVDLRMNPSSAVLWVVAVFALLVLGFRYQQLPGAGFSTSGGKTKYGWGPISVTANRGFSDGWAKWNFQGYEGKSSYAEYHDIVQTMQTLGEDSRHGCGRAIWENNGDLNKYGTTMALMLLPFWTKGCIASMEGLFFEAAGTTPYHFISAAALSKQSSNPVRELRYINNQAELGAHYMRLLGVRYLMAFTPEAINEAKKQPELVEVATSGPWHVYEIRDTTLVEPLEVQPVVVEPRPGDPRERWLELGTSYFQHTDEWNALPVASGPKEWSRIEVSVDSSRRVGEPGESGRQVDIVVPSSNTPKKLPPVQVTDVKLEDESVSFRVDKVGVPVLVKVSYFPNWKAHGASDPVRAAPNMMVVVPTSKEVRLTYEESNSDFFAYVLTSIGLILFVLMLRRPFHYGVAMPPRR